MGERYGRRLRQPGLISCSTSSDLRLACSALSHLTRASTTSLLQNANQVKRQLL
jgi:hypothetical protein